MIVYRVELKTNPEHGPFKEDAAPIWMDHWEKYIGDILPPPPWMDGIPDFNLRQDYIGVESVECLRRWFEPVAVDLGQIGYQITQYNAEDVKIGKHQIAFDLHKAQVIQHMPITEMLK